MDNPECASTTTVVSREGVTVPLRACTLVESGRIIAGVTVNSLLTKVNTPAQNGRVETSKYVHMKIPPSEWERWKVAAEADKRTLSSFVRWVIESYLDAQAGR